MIIKFMTSGVLSKGRRLEEDPGGKDMTPIPGGSHDNLRLTPPQPQVCYVTS
jgi:hypothetical protein